jgi:hypothetical protein
MSLTLGLALALTAGRAAAAILPDSERLDPVRPALERAVDQVEHDGLPADLIVSKVREGLAKGVSPEAIRAAVERLARSLGDADQFLHRHRKRPAPPALVRALAEARTAGIDLEVLGPMVASEVPDAAVVRAVDALTDLALRGYPTNRAAAVVRDVLAHDPTSIGRVVSGVEAIRVAQTISRVDALDALAQNIASSGSFDAALNRSLEPGDHSNAGGNGKSQAAEHMNPAAAGKRMKK